MKPTWRRARTLASGLRGPRRVGFTALSLDRDFSFPAGLAISDGMKTLTLVLALLCLPVTAIAERFDNIVEATLRPGWRMADGTHMAALQMRLAPGWKTYWRAPGEGGIPPLFDWSGARNLAGVTVRWPAPKVFWQAGLRSVGYDGTVILPLHVTPSRAGRDMRLGGVVDIGLCKEVCIPHRLTLSATLPADPQRPDPAIAAALAATPLTAAEAGIGPVRCRVSPSAGGLALRAEIAMPRSSGRDAVIEIADPEIWVAQPRTHAAAGLLVAEAELRHAEGGVFALDRSRLRFTVLGGGTAVDIRGCTG